MTRLIIQDNDMIDHIDVVYTKNETEYSWLVRLGDYDKN